MKKLSLSAVALIGLTAATAPAFASAHHGHHHHKKCAMHHGKKGADKSAQNPAGDNKASEDLNASSLQKAQTPAAPKAPAMPQAPAAPSAPSMPQGN